MGKQLPKLNKSALSLDVNVYFENDLFVCTNPCYKRLLKLEKLEKNIFDLKKKKLTSSFDGNVKTAREKRLRKDSDTVSECSTTAQNKLTCPGVSRSLKFVSPALTTCTSFTYNPNRAFQKQYNVVYNAFGHLEDPDIGVSTPDLSSLRPLITSTPISKPGNNNVRNETKVKVIIDYLSKMASKTLEPCYEALGKALVHNPPERIASTVVKCKPVVNIVIKHVLRKASREVNDLCSRKNPSLLRPASNEDLTQFSMEAMCHEWKKRAPIFYAFLMTIALSNGTKDSSWLPSIRFAICLHPVSC